VNSGSSGGLPVLSSGSLISSSSSSSSSSGTPTGSVASKSAALSECGPNVATDGIDIVDWQAHNVTFRSWDFAGQDVYYSTHQFFVTDAAIYLVLFNLFDLTGSRVEYWLSSIQARAPNSAVVVVGTHLDECKAKYAEEIFRHLKKKYQRAFPNIVDYVAVSTKTGKHVPELRARLAQVAAKKKLIGQQVPSSYMLIMRRIAAYKESCLRSNALPLLAWEQFCELADAVGVPPERAEHAATFLHRIGEVAYFGDEQHSLDRTVFCSPQWLVDVFSSIITLSGSSVRHGVLKHADLAFVWKPPRFPPEIHSLLLVLLEKFDVIHRLAPDERIGALGCDRRADATVPGAPSSAPSATSETTTHSATPPCVPASAPVSTSESSVEAVAEMSLVPALLPVQPMPGWSALWEKLVSEQPNTPRCATPYVGRVYTFRFLPLGFFGRLLARLCSLPLTKVSACYRDGAFLCMRESPRSGARFVYEPQLYCLSLDVCCDTDSAVRWAVMLLDCVAALLDGWYRDLLRQVQLPCPHCVRACSVERFLFRMADVERMSARGETYCYCRGTDAVALSALAPDVAMAEVARVRLEDLQIGDQVGEGAFSVVYRGQLRGKLVAVKQIHTNDDDEEELRNKYAEFCREARLMSGLAHPNLVQLSGICVADRALYMVTEFLPYGDLYDYLKKRSGTRDWAFRLRCAVVSLLYQCASHSLCCLCSRCV
jgi:leucine-rich repeat kinase 2